LDATHAVSLDELKAYLNITVTTHDSELTSLRDAVEVAAENVADISLRQQTVTSERHSGGADRIVLSTRPLVSVTTVAEDGTTLAATAYDIDLDTGILYRLSGTYTLGVWSSGHRNVSVTYEAGWSGSTVPSDIKHGILELARHLWTTQRGPTQVFGTGSDEWNPSSMHSITRRVQELLEPYRAPGVA
jgi:hypothetical protein